MGAGNLNSGSISLCVQDFILLTDFVPLPELIMIFCKGEIGEGNQTSTNDEALLNIKKIEYILTKLGKNELDLHKN